MFVYVIVNDVNWKIYIGKTKVCRTLAELRHYLQQKFHKAFYKPQERSYLHYAIRKYGRKHFYIYPLFEGSSNEEICVHEKLLIKALASRNPTVGYNICRGGEGFTGSHSEKARQKLSAISRRCYQDPAYRERRMKNWRASVNARIASGNYHGSQEARDKIKAARAVQDESIRIAGCQKYAEEHQEEMSSRMSHETHVLGGKAGSRENKQRAGRLGAELGGVKAQHTRWHINRGQVSPKCSLCSHLD